MIYPKEIIENSSEANFSRHSVRSNMIYLMVLLFVSGTVMLLPRIRIDVGVRSPGMIRADTDRMEIYSPVSGFIEDVRVTADSFVNAGDTLVTIDPGDIRNEIEHITRRIDQIEDYLSDLDALAGPESGAGYRNINLKTGRYRQSLLEFLQNLNHAENEFLKITEDAERDKILFSQDLISRREMGEVQFALERAQHQYRLLNRQQSRRRALEAAGFREEKNQLETERHSLYVSLEGYVIKSPAAGTLQNIRGLRAGSFISHNQRVAEISPESDIIAEIHVPSKDIGLIRSGMPVRIQVDSYHHNQWGLASGSVTGISGDVDFIENRPVYRVRCSIDRPFLKLSNGYRGELKKGMTLQAQFIVTKRTLFQLLFDKVDDWLHPVWKPVRQSQGE